MAKTISDFVELLEGHMDALREKNAHQIAESIYEVSGLQGLMERDSTDQGEARRAHVQELLESIALFSERQEEARLEKYMASIDLFGEEEEGAASKPKAIALMTRHACKGLAFKQVFILGLEEEVLPFFYAKSQEATEEEPRLFYAGITRAEDSLHLSHCRSRFKGGRNRSNSISRFLEELSSSHFSPPE